jgi:hypothetical protein
MSFPGVDGLLHARRPYNIHACASSRVEGDLPGANS